MHREQSKGLNLPLPQVLAQDKHRLSLMTGIWKRPRVSCHTPLEDSNQSPIKVQQDNSPLHDQLLAMAFTVVDKFQRCHLDGLVV